MIELKNFTDLSADEREMVLKWRNHESVRTYMYTNDRIHADDHENFVNSLTDRDDKRYFIVYKNGAPIGVVNLVNITDTSASLGLYANPYSERKGIGRIILRALIRYAFETLRLAKLTLECFEDNERAQTLYKKFDFTETKRSVKDNKPIICMELYNEHRQA